MKEIISVVTVFISSENRIALFKRSDRVGTYRGAWAGVSGYMERLPLDQAYTELVEETGLRHDDVDLRGIGIPILVDDRNLDCTWAIHPFLFVVHDPSKIRIDWEAERMEWMLPEDMAKLATVPGLDLALNAVWPAFGDAEFWHGLASIATDTIHGATSLAVSGLKTLEAYLNRNPDAPHTRAVHAFAACRSSMGIFPHLAARFLLDDISASELAADVEKATEASAIYAAEALTSCRRILTCSYSSAVKKAIVLLRNKVDRLEVIVTESRPEMEGVTLARELANEGIRVTVITDAQANVFMPEVDAVVVGCDAITEDDRLQNKAGTSLLALSAHSHNIKCIGITQTFKIIPLGFPHVGEEQDPDRVGQCEGIKFRNVIFDTTPLSMFDAVYTEDGVLSSSQLSLIRNRLTTGFRHS